MAQHYNFYRIHGLNGELYKSLILDSGLYDNKILFPISQIKNSELFELYKNCITAKREYLCKLSSFEYYLNCRWNYYKELPKYHKKRG